MAVATGAEEFDTLREILGGVAFHAVAALMGAFLLGKAKALDHAPEREHETRAAHA